MTAHVCIVPGALVDYRNSDQRMSIYMYVHSIVHGELEYNSSTVVLVLALLLALRHIWHLENAVRFLFVATAVTPDT